jgi:hypothetical protein
MCSEVFDVHVGLLFCISSGWRSWYDSTGKQAVGLKSLTTFHSAFDLITISKSCQSTDFALRLAKPKNRRCAGPGAGSPVNLGFRLNKWICLLQSGAGHGASCVVLERV